MEVKTEGREFNQKTIREPEVCPLPFPYHKKSLFVWHTGINR